MEPAMNEHTLRTGNHANPPEAAATRYWVNAHTVRIGSTIMLFLILVIFAAGAWVSDGFTDKRITGVGSDFSVFWSASYIALHDSALQAYNLDRMMAVIHQFGTLASGSDR